MQAKPHKVKYNQALTSLNNCREWLSDCLNFLEGGHKTEIFFKLRNLHLGEQILYRYVKHIKRLFRNYVEIKLLFGSMNRKNNTKVILQNLLKGNVIIIDLAIQMLQLFVVIVTKHPKKSKAKKLFPTRGQDMNNSDLSKVESIELPKSQNQKKNKDKQNIIKKSLESPLISDTSDGSSVTASKKILYLKRAKSEKFLSSKNEPKKEYEESDESSVTLTRLYRISETNDVEYNLLPHYAKSKKKFSFLKQSNNGSRKNSVVRPFPRQSYNESKKLLVSSPFLPGRVRSSLKSAADLVIETLFSQKNTPRSTLKNTHKEDFAKGEELMANVWISLVDMHNKLIQTEDPQRIDDVKDDLVHHYLHEMQLNLSKAIDKPGYESKKHSIQKGIGTGFIISSRSLQNLTDQHKTIFRSQLHKLRTGPKDVNLKRMFNIIMSHRVPKSKSDISLLELYQNDSHFYNALMLARNDDEPHHDNLLKKIESNFEEIQNLIVRQKRQQKMMLMMQNTRLSGSMSNDIRTSNVSSNDNKAITFNENFFKTERAKWVEYFSTRKKSSIEFQLEKKKMDKEEEAAQQRLNLIQKTYLRKRKCHKALQRIISLYSAPRLTHRLREALDRITEDELYFRPNIKCETQFFNDVRENVSEPIEKECIQKKDVFEDCIFWRSCCSKCKSLQEGVQPNTALQRFHRMHEQIMSNKNFHVS